MKCYECKSDVDKADAKYIDKHYYHINCYNTMIDRRHFIEYVCKIYKLKAPGPVIYSQRKQFMTKYGYTDIGMINTLRYAYEVKHIKTEKAQERIGIIPLLYDEAQTFYKSKLDKQNSIAKKYDKITEQSRPIIVQDTIRDCNLYDMSLLNELKEE